MASSMRCLPPEKTRHYKSKQVNKVIAYLHDNHPTFTKFDIDRVIEKLGLEVKARTCHRVLFDLPDIVIVEKISYSTIFAWAAADSMFPAELIKASLDNSRKELKAYWADIAECKRIANYARAGKEYKPEITTKSLAQRSKETAFDKIKNPRQVTLLELLSKIRKE